MNNKEKYAQVFIDGLKITEDKLPGLKYQDVALWDSVGHMGLIAGLEETFDIMLEMDDIIDFSSYKRGVDILAKYSVEI